MVLISIWFKAFKRTSWSRPSRFGNIDYLVSIKFTAGRICGDENNLRRGVEGKVRLKPVLGPLSKPVGGLVLEAGVGISIKKTMRTIS